MTFSWLLWLPGVRHCERSSFGLLGGEFRRQWEQLLGEKTELPRECRVRDRPTMVGTATAAIRARQAFSVVNGGQDLSPNSAPPSNAGSECGGIEFTREDVEALLSEKLKAKNKFNYKVRFLCLSAPVSIGSEMQLWQARGLCGWNQLGFRDKLIDSRLWHRYHFVISSCHLIPHCWDC